MTGKCKECGSPLTQKDLSIKTCPACLAAIKEEVQLPPGDVDKPSGGMSEEQTSIKKKRGRPPWKHLQVKENLLVQKEEPGPAIKTIICAKCHIEKPISEFHKDRTKVTGIKGKCKQCRNEAQRRSDNLFKQPQDVNIHKKISLLLLEVLPGDVDLKVVRALNTKISNLIHSFINKKE